MLASEASTGKPEIFREVVRHDHKHNVRDDILAEPPRARRPARNGARRNDSQSTDSDASAIHSAVEVFRGRAASQAGRQARRDEPSDRVGLDLMQKIAAFFGHVDGIIGLAKHLIWSRRRNRDTCSLEALRLCPGDTFVCLFRMTFAGVANSSEPERAPRLEPLFPTPIRSLAHAD